MKKKVLNIDDLLSALKNPENIEDDLKAKVSLANTAETWARIGAKDTTLATDLGIDESELNDFLREWVEDNPYTNL